MKKVLGGGGSRKKRKGYKSPIKAGGSGKGHSGIELADAASDEGEGGGEGEEDFLVEEDDDTASDEGRLDVDDMPDDGPQPRQGFLVRYFMPLVDGGYEEHAEDAEFHASGGERDLWFLVTLVMMLVVVLVLGALYWDFFG